MSRPEPVDSFSAAYYQSGNYHHYLERADRYERTATEIAGFIRALGLSRGNQIVDLGCAVGFLMAGLKAEGFENVVGVDVSAWAVSEARKAGHVAVTDAREVTGPVDLLLALDVFEHMTDKAIRDVFEATRPAAFIARIPSSIDGGKTFALEASRADKTHINCRTKQQWQEFFEDMAYRYHERGYTTLRIRLLTIYDTPGVTCLLGLRR